VTPLVVTAEHKEQAVMALALARFLESCKGSGWVVNQKTYDEVVATIGVEPAAIEKRVKKFGRQISRMMSDADEMAEWSFGPSGFVPGLMLKR
jgi:hypothetical protein